MAHERVKGDEEVRANASVLAVYTLAYTQSYTSDADRRDPAQNRPMPTTRISEQGLRVLQELSQAMKQPQPAVLDEALDALQRKRFFETLNRQYAALRTNESAWAKETAERRLWDQTSADAPVE